MRDIPKATWDYSQTKIYRIINKITGKQYVGHTTYKYLSQRLRMHRQKYTNWLLGKETWQSSFDVMDKDKNVYEIVLIENYPCKDVNEARARERYWIENIEGGCVNKTLPSRTKQEIGHLYNANLETFNCACGGSYKNTSGKKERHENTKLHKYYVEHGCCDERTPEQRKKDSKMKWNEKNKDYYHNYYKSHKDR